MLVGVLEVRVTDLDVLLDPNLLHIVPLTFEAPFLSRRHRIPGRQYSFRDPVKIVVVEQSLRLSLGRVRTIRLIRKIVLGVH